MLHIRFVPTDRNFECHTLFYPKKLRQFNARHQAKLLSMANLIRKYELIILSFTLYLDVINYSPQIRHVKLQLSSTVNKFKPIRAWKYDKGIPSDQIKWNEMVVVVVFSCSHVLCVVHIGKHWTGWLCPTASQRFLSFAFHGKFHPLGSVQVFLYDWIRLYSGCIWAGKSLRNRRGIDCMHSMPG